MNIYESCTHSLTQSIMHYLPGRHASNPPPSCFWILLCQQMSFDAQQQKKINTIFQERHTFFRLFSLNFQDFFAQRKKKKKKQQLSQSFMVFFSAFILYTTWSNAYVVCYEFSVGRRCIVDAFISLFDDLTSIVVGFVLKLGTCLCKMIAMSFSCSSNRQSSMNRSIMRCVYTIIYDRKINTFPWSRIHCSFYLKNRGEFDKIHVFFIDVILVIAKKILKFNKTALEAEFCE